MNIKDFIAADVAVALPSKSYPKVYLAIGSAQLAKLSFHLYNPFSVKGKVFKWMVRQLCVCANSVAKIVLPTLKHHSSIFVQYLENELGIKLISSVYIATARDKVVVQLIKGHEIYGYLKFPLTPVGEKRLQNENRAVEVLSKIGLVSGLLYSGSYNSVPFIVLENIQGAIGELANKEYSKLLAALEKNKSFRLKEHPRVISLQKQVKEANFVNLDKRLSGLIELSNLYYKEVYEHGDFAPWNIIQTNKGLVPFDFEYFVEIGLEYLDELKYHYQIEHLLNAKNGSKLIESIATKVAIPEFKIIFQLFLIKEILVKGNGNESVGLEKDLLEISATMMF